MPIDYRQLRTITAREFVRALERDGFELRRKRAISHRQYIHPEDKRRVTVTYHGHSRTFPLGTLKRMIEHDAQWTEDDLKRLKLLK